MLHLLVCEQIIGSNPDEQQKSYGVHFEMEDELVSHITERLILLVKQTYRASPMFLLHLHILCRSRLFCMHIYELLIIFLNMHCHQQDDLSLDDWKLVAKLKHVLGIHRGPNSSLVAGRT
jgi:hypothetical protein